MHNLRRTLYVTEHYPHLQGLRLVPLALCFLASAAWRAGLLDWLPGIAHGGARVWFLTSVSFALIVSFPIRAYYRRRVGIARPLATRADAVNVTMCFAYFALLTALPPNRWHVSVPMLFAALALAYVGLANRRVRRHYLGIAVACLAFALAPLVGVTGTAQDVSFDLLIGLGLLVAGVGDHLVLQRTLQAPDPEGAPYARAA